MKLFSFLGAGDYETTSYTFNENSCNTDCIQKAICEFFPEIDEVVLFTTEFAFQKSYSNTKEELESTKLNGIISVRNVNVPDGMDEKELWDIFRIISGEVSEGDKIIFDITHGFRSLPFVSYLIASYLRSTGKVDIEKILYGTFRKDNTSNPILDLTPFVSISDWIAGAHSFTDSLDAGKLSELISEINKKAYLENKDSDNTPKKLLKWSKNLNDFTIAVRLSRPIDSFNKAESIFQDYDQVKSELERYVPFIDPIQSKIFELEKYSIKKPKFGEITWEYAEKQMDLIGLMNEKELYLQSMALAREFLITLLILWHGKYCSMWLNHDIRTDSGKTLGGPGLEKREKEYERIPEFSDWLDEHSEEKEIMSNLWESISKTRNDLAHCGMRTDPAPISKFPEKAKNIYLDLRDFFLSIRPE
ncbi:MAG: TIGR02221 family CRISPR-associated protein [Methanomicrobiaceae archaeon]|nr:TIGR02221 family CRISPR-associated protein [Methanomicrobiaceae archaeon]